MKELEQGLGTGRTGHRAGLQQNQRENSTQVLHLTAGTQMCKIMGKGKLQPVYWSIKPGKVWKVHFFFFFSNKNTSSFVNSILRLVLRRNYIVFKMP